MKDVNLIKVLSNVKSLKTFLQKQDKSTLERLYNNFNTVYQEICISLEEEQKELAEKERKRQELLKFIKEEGFDPNTINIPVTGGKAKNTKKAKYRYENKNGDIVEWTGCGRMPNDLKEKVDNGQPLESFLI